MKRTASLEMAMTTIAVLTNNLDLFTCGAVLLGPSNCMARFLLQLDDADNTDSMSWK